MTKPLKITSIVLLSLCAIAIIGYFIANAIVTSKLKKFLDTELPDNMTLNYDDLEVSLWQGSVSINKPRIVSKGKHTATTNLIVDLETLSIEGFKYWGYIFSDHIDVSRIQFKRPRLEYMYDPIIPKDEYSKNSGLKNFNQNINIEHFDLENGEIIMREVTKDSVVMFAEQIKAQINKISINEVTVKEKIPFKYEGFNLSLSDLFYSLGDYENVTASKIETSQDKTLINELKLFTKYSKAKLSQIINVERDHFDISIPSLTFENHHFGFEKDSIFFFDSPKVIFENPEMYIYRDKLIADDTSRKDLYSKMLRDLPFSLTLADVKLNNATIVYSEKVNADMPAGKLSFSKMNADIKNISNTYGKDQRTTLDIDAIFMARTPIKVNWEFDVNDSTDAFVFKADIKKLPSPDLNPFSQPNLKVNLEGELLQTYATISGDVNTSRVNMKAKYDDFKVVILDKEGKKKKKILSAIANLFIKKDSDKAEEGFRESFKENIERDKTKSIFNFLWMSLKAGLVSIMTGNGKE